MLRAVSVLGLWGLCWSSEACASEFCQAEEDTAALLQHDTSPSAKNPHFNILQVTRSLTKKASKCANDYYKKLEAVELPADYEASWEPRSLPATPRDLVICAGMGTTGTHGLVVALEELGLHGYHFKDARASANEHAKEHKLPEFLSTMVQGIHGTPEECYDTIQNFDFSGLPSNVDYVSDTPFTESFLDLYAQFPNAKVILTTRPSLEWAKSRKKHAKSPPPVLRPCGLPGVAQYKDEDLVTMLEAYNDLVRCVVPKKNLLEISLFEEGTNLTDDVGAFLKQIMSQKGPEEHEAKP